MKKTRFTEEQIALALHRAEDGTSVDDICRKLGIGHSTFYKWKQKYGGLLPSEVKKLKSLEEENKRLKQLVADLSLDKNDTDDFMVLEGNDVFVIGRTQEEIDFMNSLDYGSSL